MRTAILCLLLTTGILSWGQAVPTFKFGKISADDFSKTVYAVDSIADAVVLADIGSSKIKGNNKGWFSLEYKQFRRVHILKKSAFAYASIEIPLYTDGEDEEKLDDLKAVTYNLVNGKLT